MKGSYYWLTNPACFVSPAIRNAAAGRRRNRGEKPLGDLGIFLAMEKRIIFNL